MYIIHMYVNQIYKSILQYRTRTKSEFHISGLNNNFNTKLENSNIDMKNHYLYSEAFSREK